MDGYSPGWTDITAGEMIAGRDFTVMENESAAPAVVIHDKGAERLFDDTDPLGKDVSVNNKPFRVIGVYQPLGNVSRQAAMAGSTCPSRRLVGGSMSESPGWT